MRRRVRYWFTTLSFTAAMMGLIILATFDTSRWPFVLVLLGMVGGSASFFYTTFPGSRFFVLAFTNSLGVYACIFQFFAQVNFRPVSTPILEIGFALPILAFVAGAWREQQRIRDIIHLRTPPAELALFRAFAWLVPVFGVGALTFTLPDLALDPVVTDEIFLASMLAIAGVVLVVSPDVSMFLIDTGLLFEEFFARVRHLAAPAFAFTTFYSVIVVVFASLYRIIDLVTGHPNFLVGGAVRPLGFSEALYFSVITVATVGYGDILPRTDLARALASIEVLIGVLVLLFGFSEIMAYMRERRPNRSE